MVLTTPALQTFVNPSMISETAGEAAIFLFLSATILSYMRSRMVVDAVIRPGSEKLYGISLNCFRKIGLSRSLNETFEEITADIQSSSSRSFDGLGTALDGGGCEHVI